MENSMFTSAEKEYLLFKEENVGDQYQHDVVELNSKLLKVIEDHLGNGDRTFISVADGEPEEEILDEFFKFKEPSFILRVGPIDAYYHVSKGIRNNIPFMLIGAGCSAHPAFCDLILRKEDEGLVLKEFPNLGEWIYE